MYWQLLHCLAATAITLDALQSFGGTAGNNCKKKRMNPLNTKVQLQIKQQ